MTFVTLREAAQELGMSYEGLRRIIKRLNVEHYRIGRLYKFERQELLSHFKERPCTEGEKSGGPLSVEYANRLGLRSRRTQKPTSHG